MPSIPKLQRKHFVIASTALLTLGLFIVVSQSADPRGTSMPSTPISGTDSLTPEAISKPAPKHAAPSRNDLSHTGLGLSLAELSVSDLPNSLEGTDVDGGFAIDEEGNFIAAQTTLRLFNYFFSASGEESLASIQTRIEQQIAASLQPPARQQALDFLADFIRYREAGAELRERIEYEALDMPQRAAALRDMRREVFGEARAQALFGEEELIRDIHIARSEVSKDPALSATEKQAKIAELESQLPARIQRQYAQSQAPIKLQDQVQALRQQGASDTEIFELRASRFDAAAAKRLAAMDQRRSALQQHVKEYQQFQATTVELPANERQQALEAYLASNHEPKMATRIKTLAQMQP